LSTSRAAFLVINFCCCTLSSTFLHRTVDNFSSKIFSKLFCRLGYICVSQTHLWRLHSHVRIMYLHIILSHWAWPQPQYLNLGCHDPVYFENTCVNNIF
jgi:hypothetical protein